MGRRQQTGFTVIEVVLVIAISGLIAMGVLSNSSRQVNIQNYRDGVESFRDFLAGQFEDLDAVKNNEAGGCAPGSTDIRGAGDCFYSGKYISITPMPDDETRLVARPIQTKVDEDTDEISNVTVTDDTDENVQSTKIDWGLQARTKAGLEMSRYLTIFRSPVTGRVSSYVTQGDVSSTDTRLKNVVTGVANGNAVYNPEPEDIIICLADPTNDTPGQWMAVRITKGAVDASGITTMAGQCT